MQNQQAKYQVTYYRGNGKRWAQFFRSKKRGLGLVWVWLQKRLPFFARGYWDFRRTPLIFLPHPQEDIWELEDKGKTRPLCFHQNNPCFPIGLFHKSSWALLGAGLHEINMTQP